MALMRNIPHLGTVDGRCVTPVSKTWRGAREVTNPATAGVELLF